MNIHELKIWPVHFNNVLKGTKTFEIRNNDRAFQKGDEVILKEYDPTVKGYSDDIQSGEYVVGYTNNKLYFVIGDVYPIDSERVVFSLLNKDSK